MVGVLDTATPVDPAGLTEETTMRTSLVIAGSITAGALAFALAAPVVAANATGSATGDAHALDVHEIDVEVVPVLLLLFAFDRVVLD